MLVPLISLDTETTGLDPARHAPWEIGWVTAVHDTTARTIRPISGRSFFLPIPDDAAVDPYALEVGRFAARYDRENVTPWYGVLGELTADLDGLHDAAASAKREQAILLGMVPQFDHRMLERWLGWDHRLWHYHLVDVETLAAGKLGLHPPYSSTEILDWALGTRGRSEFEGSLRHTALGDAAVTLEVYASVNTADIIDEID